MARWNAAVGAAELSNADPALARLIKVVGPPRVRSPYRGPDGHFLALARSIAFQQLAGAAAASIWRRVEGALGEVTPHTVTAASDEVLRGAGLSGAKTRSLRALAEAVHEGLDLDGLARRPDHEVEARLVELRGIGPWTAQMFLIFQLRRTDVWPIGDLGVRRGYALLHRLPVDPSPAELEVLGERYRPWRSMAAWYMWRAIDTVTPEGW